MKVSTAFYIAIISAFTLKLAWAQEINFYEDLINPSVTLPKCFTKVNRYGWENFYNYTTNRRPLVMDMSAWDSARLATRLIQIILEEVMGFKVVVKEYVGGSITRTRLAKGVSDIALEIWWGQQPTWKSYGSIGYQGRSGLYVPTRLVQQYPELGLDFWRFLRNPEARKLFVNAAEGPRMRTASGGYVCDNIKNGCQKGLYLPKGYKESNASAYPEIWLMYPGWSKWNYERMTDGLDLNVVLNWLGDDTEKLVQQYLTDPKAKGIIFYNWVPTAFVALANVTRLMMPYDGEGLYQRYQLNPEFTPLVVDEPLAVLLKAGSSYFDDTFIEPANLISKFELRDDEINWMLRLLSMNITYDEAACQWAKLNEARWKDWIPAPPESFEQCPRGTGRFFKDGLALCFQCPVDSFNWNPNNTGACLSCPSEGICPGGATVNSRKGYYLVDPALTNSTSPQFYSCPYKESCCPGNNCTISQVCDEGFTGLLCSECARQGDYLWRGKCIPCDKIGSSLYLLIFLSMVATLAILFIPRDELPTIELLFFFFQVSHLIFGVSIGELSGMNHLKTFLAFASLDIDGMVADCPAKLAGVEKMLFRYVLPFAFYVHLGIIYAVAKLMIRANLGGLFTWYLKGRSIDDVFFKALLSITTFTLLPLIEASVSLLECRSVMGELVLFKAPYVKCYKGNHNGPVAFAIIVLLVILGVLPLALIGLLGRLKQEGRVVYDKTAELSQRDQLYQNLYLQYRPQYLFMESYFIFERGAVVILFTILHEENLSSAFGYVGIIGAIVFVRIYLQPFESQLESFLSREVAVCWLILLAIKYTTFRAGNPSVGPYIIFIMLIPPVLHVIRLILVHTFRLLPGMGRSAEHVAVPTGPKQGGKSVDVYKDAERVPLSREVLNEA
ncbi:hypothetical protein HDU96_007697 [Phlyctochytrium bullatum]|nr:hypothetical protein HDU96_007697 [Phlyctochytrium bullatum]